MNTSLAVAALLLVFAGARAQSDTTKAFTVDKIIAKVDNKILLKSELESTYQQYLTAGNPASETEKCSLLGVLIRNKLMVAKAEIDSVLVTDAEVDNNTEQRMAMLLQSDGNAAAELEKRWGKSLAEVKADIREQVREQMLSQEMQQRITKEITITPSEVRKFIGKVPQDSLPYYSSDVEVAQIVKLAHISNEQKENVKAKLLDIRQQIMNGANWNEMARKFSEDPSAVQNGGELGRQPRGAMVAEFESMAFRLQPGEISQPFASEYGYHIMQLQERNGNEYMSRHILIAAVPSPADLVQAGRYLDSLRRKIMTDSLKFGEAAKFLSDDKATKDHGGFLTDRDGSTRISMDSKDIDYTLYSIIDTLKVGAISRPAPYRLDGRKPAMRILWKKAQIKPHRANLSDDWSRLQAGALAEKRDKALDKWFNKAKSDVFINIDPDYKTCKSIME